MAEAGPRLLWTDDDGPNRFEYERYRIEQRGWSIQWANSVIAAAQLLAEQAFDALILDQMIPYQGIDRGVLVPWGGCLLLRWLRRRYPPQKAPLDGRAPDDLRGLVPLTRNTTMPVMIMSAFHDDDVLAEMRAAGELDRALRIFPKPTSDKEILDFLKGAQREGDR